MAKRIKGTTPREDGYRMPAEWKRQDMVYMVWPERAGWPNYCLDVRRAYCRVAEAISKHTPVTMIVSGRQYPDARVHLSDDIRVIEISNNDCWFRDSGPTFLVNDRGDVRACDWEFNAWGGLYDGLFFPWNLDDLVPRKLCEIEGIDSYRTKGFVLEGGSISVDGEGTVLTTEMCLLSPGRNPHMTKEGIERMLCEYLNCRKVLWLKDGIDPWETNGHVDDVAVFVRPGEVACIYTDDPAHPFYKVAQDAYQTLLGMTDAKGRRLKVHKVPLTKEPIYYKGAETAEWDCLDEEKPADGGLCAASYVNFLISNGAVFVPQYDDPNDGCALEAIREIFPDHEVVGIPTRDIVYGGGNIHCITQNRPAAGEV